MSIREALARAKEKMVTCRKFGTHMIVRSAVPPTTTTLTPITKKELERKTKKQQKKNKGDEVHCGRKNMKNSTLRCEMRNANAHRG